jgi:hypothetical protein
VEAAKMVAAGREDAALGIALQQPAHRDVQRFPAHVLADPDQLALGDLLLDLLMLPGQLALLNGSCGHSRRQLLEVEVGDVAPVALEVGVVPEELVEFVAPRLPLQEDVLAVGVEGLLDLAGDGEGEDALARAELDVDELRRDQLVLKGLFRDELGLHVVVGHCLQPFLGTAGDEGHSVGLGIGLDVQLDNLLDYRVYDFVVDFGEVGYLDVVSLFVFFFRLVDVLGKPLAALLLLPGPELGTAQQVPFVLLLGDEEALLVGTLHLFLQVAAMGRAELGADNCGELALPLLALHEKLAHGLGLFGNLLRRLSLLLFHRL